jgi:hypothetical protein
MKVASTAACGPLGPCLLGSSLKSSSLSERQGPFNTRDTTHQLSISSAHRPYSEKCGQIQVLNAKNRKKALRLRHMVALSYKSNINEEYFGVHVLPQMNKGSVCGAGT